MNMMANYALKMNSELKIASNMNQMVSNVKNASLHSMKNKNIVMKLNSIPMQQKHQNITTI